MISATICFVVFNIYTGDAPAEELFNPLEASVIKVRFGVQLPALFSSSPSTPSCLSDI